MLLAPFLLTIGMGFVTGRFSGSASGLSDIPVIIVNLDDEQLGDALADVFSSEDLADLMEPTASSDPEAARRLIDEDEAAAAVIIPEGFTQSVIPAEGTMLDPNYVQPKPVKIEVYTNPSSPTSAGVIKAIVDEYVSRVEEGRTSGMTSIVQLMASGLLNTINAESETDLFQKCGRNGKHCHHTQKTRKAPAVFDPLSALRRHGIAVFDVHRFIRRTFHPCRTLTRDAAALVYCANT
jgi:hypothetical protein